MEPWLYGELFNSQALAKFLDAMPVIEMPMPLVPVPAVARSYCTTLSAPPTIVAVGDAAMAYVNQGQSYALTCAPALGNVVDEVVQTDIIVEFNDPHQRAQARDLWYTWANQHNVDPLTQAISVGPVDSLAAVVVPTVAIDRVTVQWNSRTGLHVPIRLNFLSTDFSRRKGVRGTPMRLVVRHTPVGQAGLCPSVTQRILVKSFQDKGAARRLKSDLQRQAKITGSMVLPFTSQQITVFSDSLDPVSEPTTINEVNPSREAMTTGTNEAALHATTPVARQRRAKGQRYMPYSLPCGSPFATR
ncbi:hypothetical protein H4R34_001964 [Dimargaris verticillata]|uniref:Grh/CP2 DB domain-containing protein n=1 Tax=Dimargaris verticillata TaxID=2761393 RepID=A0A9W8B8Y9_9FUNG|nr:hypothetical protein H4R34_001964 [Dimargaris verticillata]